MKVWRKTARNQFFTNTNYHYAVSARPLRPKCINNPTNTRPRRISNNIRPNSSASRTNRQTHCQRQDVQVGTQNTYERLQVICTRLEPRGASRRPYLKRLNSINPVPFYSANNLADEPSQFRGDSGYHESLLFFPFKTCFFFPNPFLVVFPTSI